MCGGSGARPEASLLTDGIVCCIRVDGWHGLELALNEDLMANFPPS